MFAIPFILRALGVIPTLIKTAFTPPLRIFTVAILAFAVGWGMGWRTRNASCKEQFERARAEAIAAEYATVKKRAEANEQIAAKATADLVQLTARAEVLDQKVEDYEKQLAEEAAKPDAAPDQCRISKRDLERLRSLE
jgi:hypothetical protein